MENPHAFTNELIHESSPYLLQHAHNPVQWHPWGEKALSLARKADKPILVSIGYSACHWCHVMERESFEDESVAAYMNEHFINIKIDREERPDLDHIYMDAVQAIAGNGGWPLNVFLTTDARPFYGGTYFPPVKAFNRASWKDVLVFIKDLWENKRSEVEKQAAILLEHISTASGFLSRKIQPAGVDDSNGYTQNHISQIVGNILKQADTQEGGFGRAPKFPQTFILQFLLQNSFLNKDEQSLQQAELSLRKMLHGGIYDQIGGGLSRYSTDTNWLVPHFEKMLYDNALLVSVLCDAYLVTGNELYKDSIDKTIEFLIREMKDADGGFYAAIDADSEGVEGKFYVWTKEEIDNILGSDSEIFCKRFGVTTNGNWEHKNILSIQTSWEQLSEESGIEIEKLKQNISAASTRLLAVRNKRVRPATDDKMLLGWNALLLTAFCKSSAVSGNELYKQEAIQLYQFLVNNFSENGLLRYHSFKNQTAKHPAYLDDYAAFIQACIDLQQIVPGEEFLLNAIKTTDFVLQHFYSEENGFFYYTHKNQQDIIARKIEMYDGATASGNSIMAGNLFYLSLVSDNRKWWAIANNMLNVMQEIIIGYPSSFGYWCQLIQQQVSGTKEIIITGKNQQKLFCSLQKTYLPGKVLHSAEVQGKLPVFRDKTYGEKPLIYVCSNYSCSPPVEDIEAFYQLLKITRK